MLAFGPYQNTIQMMDDRAAEAAAAREKLADHLIKMGIATIRPPSLKPPEPPKPKKAKAYR